MPQTVDPTVRRFMRHVQTGTTVDDCWLWTGATNNKGYGRFRVGGRGGTTEQPHRWSYQRVHGELPAGVQVDHTQPECPKNCVHPGHLRPATNKQNLENRAGATARTVSGVRGVSRHGNRWCASVTHHGVKHYLGLFDDIAAAERVVIAKRRELFTHNTIDRRV